MKMDYKPKKVKQKEHILDMQLIYQDIGPRSR